MCLAVPGKVLSLAGDDPLTRTARVAFAGVVKETNLAFAPEAKTGDYVLVHAGFAIAVLDEIRAEQTLAALRAIGQVDTPSEPGA